MIMIRNATFDIKGGFSTPGNCAYVHNVKLPNTKENTLKIYFEIFFLQPFYSAFLRLYLTLKSAYKHLGLYFMKSIEKVSVRYFIEFKIRNI